MDNFKVIYKILKYLESNMDCDDVDIRTINHTVLKISETRWEQILIMLYQNGYIDGIKVVKSVCDCKCHITEPIKPVITLKGLEYLEENSLMKKVKNTIKDVMDIVPMR